LGEEKGKNYKCVRNASLYTRRVCVLTTFFSLFGFLFILFNLIGWWKGTGRKIALFIPAAIKIIIVAVFVYTSWYKGGYNGLIRVLFSRAVTQGLKKKMEKRAQQETRQIIN